jgi:hypothetical protein
MKEILQAAIRALWNPTALKTAIVFISIVVIIAGVRRGVHFLVKTACSRIVLC